MPDDQLGFDIQLDARAEQTAWDEWVAPQRRGAQVKKFLERAGLPALPPEPWDFESDEAYRINDVVSELFPDIETVKLPENWDLADQLACTIGAWFVQYINAQWCDMTQYSHLSGGFNDTRDISLYQNYKPGIVFEFDNWRSCTAEFLVQYVIEDEFLPIIELSSVGFHRRDSPDSIRKMRYSLPDHPPFMNS